MATLLDAKQQNITNGIESTIKEIKDTSLPYLPFGISLGKTGNPTTPPMARQFLANTVTLKTNSDLSHSCDFAFDLNSLDLSLGTIPDPVATIKKAILEGKNAASAIVKNLIGLAIDQFRLGIEGILLALNFDPSGELSKLFSQAKKIIRFINEKLKEIAEYVAVASLYYYLLKSIQEIIDFIKSLPAKILAMIQQCFTKFTNSIKNAADQIAALPGSVLAGTGTSLTGSSKINYEQSINVSIAAITSSAQATLDSMNSAVSTANVPSVLMTAINSPGSANSKELQIYFSTAYPNSNTVLANSISSVNTSNVANTLIIVNTVSSNVANVKGYSSANVSLP
jgi:hypothetical protein